MAFLIHFLLLYIRQDLITAMAPRSPLEINTASLVRLVKEEASYHKEFQQQSERIKKLEGANGVEDDDGNRAYLLNQEVMSAFFFFFFLAFVS